MSTIFYIGISLAVVVLCLSLIARTRTTVNAAISSPDIHATALAIFKRKYYLINILVSLAYLVVSASLFFDEEYRDFDNHILPLIYGACVLIIFVWYWQRHYMLTKAAPVQKQLAKEMDTRINDAQNSRKMIINALKQLENAINNQGDVSPEHLQSVKLLQDKVLAMPVSAFQNTAQPLVEFSNLILSASEPVETLAEKAHALLTTI